MMTIESFGGTGGPLTMLCLGAHPDDVEIGCGGVVLRLLRARPGSAVHWVVLSGAGGRREEATQSAADFLAGAGSRHVTVKDFRDGFFPYAGYEIKEYFEEIKRTVSPDLVFTHYRDDRHQDHRVVNELTWNTYRDHMILEYEVPKYDGDLGSPNFFAYLDAETADAKVDLIWQHFATQRQKHWLTRDNLLALLRIRGIESRAPSGLAEAFYCRKLAF
jgi:LmbE family N-acetylglucosaminyl deacetylase